MRSSCELLSMLPLMACGSTVREAFNVRRIGGNVSSDQNAVSRTLSYIVATLFEHLFSLLFASKFFYKNYVSRLFRVLFTSWLNFLKLL